VANLCHRDSHEHPEALAPGKTYTLRIQLDDVAYRIPKGHRLRVSISTSYWPLIWPAPEPVTLTVQTGASYIDVPVRKPGRNEVAPVFAPAEAAPAVKLTVLDKPWNKRELAVDQRTVTVSVVTADRESANEISLLPALPSMTYLRPHRRIKLSHRRVWSSYKSVWMLAAPG
jgi:predicted acyl esterase